MNDGSITQDINQITVFTPDVNTWPAGEYSIKYVVGWSNESTGELSARLDADEGHWYLGFSIADCQPGWTGGAIKSNLPYEIDGAYFAISAYPGASQPMIIEYYGGNDGNCPWTTNVPTNTGTV